MWTNENLYDSLIQRAIDRQPADYRPPLPLVKAIIGKESGFRPQAFNPEGTGNDPSDDSYGLGQLNIRTVRRMGFDSPPALLYDPDTNVRYVVRLVGDLWRRYNGAVATVLATYNAGMHPDGTPKRTTAGAFVNQPYVNDGLRFYEYFRGAAPLRPQLQVAGLDRGALFWLVAALLLSALFGRGRQT